MVIWKDVPVLIKHKIWHIKKIGGRILKSFCVDYGDIPVVRFNEQTKKFEECVNTRGTAYAARRRQKYRKNKKKESHEA